MNIIKSDNIVGYVTLLQVLVSLKPNKRQSLNELEAYVKNYFEMSKDVRQFIFERIFPNLSSLKCIMLLFEVLSYSKCLFHCSEPLILNFIAEYNK